MIWVILVTTHEESVTTTRYLMNSETSLITQLDFDKVEKRSLFLLISEQSDQTEADE
jgi:hypothetical protein